ncbi:MAG: hypothetical protein JNL73_05110 [Anaerolineales bacterium]|nr:hypothetical protein [Anaerolineales bacterium]
MTDPRRSAFYVIRIWCEPSRLAPPGEWRGSLRAADGSRERLFKSADELWRYLTTVGPNDPARYPAMPIDLPGGTDD